MRIEFIESVAGANFAYYPKEIHDLPEQIARDFIRTGKAIEVAAAADENPALLKRGRRRGGTRAETQQTPAGERRLI